MTLIGRQPRLIQPKNFTTSPGPGIYNISSSNIESNSYAPFNSLISRFPKQSNNKDVGPGAYQIQSTIGCPSYVKFENQRNIIIKINDFGSSVFRSKSNRFNDSILSTPGVGQYEVQTKKVTKTHKKGLCKSTDHKVLNIIREHNREQQLKYQEKHPKVTVQNQQKQPKVIGPGSYSYSQSLNKKHTASSMWSLSKAKRFDQSKIQQLPDVSVVVDQIKREKQKQSSIKPSSFFKSQTVKSYFDQLTYETSSSVKLCIRKQLNYKSQSPAPGSYNLQVQKNNKNVFQFFGSTEQRFKEIEGSQIGPGQYYIPSNFKQKNSKHIIDLSKRTDFDQSNWIPGPGTYNLQSSFANKHQTNVEQFGSLQPRFKSEQHVVKQESKDSKRQSKTSFNLNYQDSKYHNKSENKKIKYDHKKRISSFFKSSTHSKSFTEHSSVPFANYDVQKSDIGRIAQKQKNYLEQLQKSNLKRPPFNSGSKRFKSLDSQKLNLSDVNIPRLYEQDQYDKQSSAFRSSTNRNFIKKADGPGVGSYLIEGSIAKDTFNRKYANKPCGVKAKLQIFKKAKEIK